MRKKTLFGHDLSEIYNFNEDLVIDLLERKLLEDESVCKCNTCLEDMYALALKMIDSQYHPNATAERASREYIMAQDAFRKKAEIKLQDAIDIIKNKPHH